MTHEVFRDICGGLTQVWVRVDGRPAVCIASLMPDQSVPSDDVLYARARAYWAHQDKVSAVHDELQQRYPAAYVVVDCDVVQAWGGRGRRLLAEIRV